MFGEWTSSELCHSFLTPQHLTGEKRNPGKPEDPCRKYTDSKLFP